MASLNLKIVTPEQIVFEGEADQVNVSTTKGELGILPHHANLMAKLLPGELKIRKSGKTNFLAIGDGFLQIEDNALTIMTDLSYKNLLIWIFLFFAKQCGWYTPMRFIIGDLR